MTNPPAPDPLRVLPWRTVAGCCAVALCLLAGVRPALAQPAPSGDVALVTYLVAAGRVVEFERLLDQFARRLQGGGTAERPRIGVGLRLFRADPAEADGVLFVLLVEPVTPGEDYSLERLIVETGDRDAGQLLERLRALTDGAAPYMASLQMLARVSPNDALRARLDAALGGQLSATVASSASQSTTQDPDLERLRAPMWAVGPVRYEVLGRSRARWRFRWTSEIRNPSLLQPLFATIKVELRDEDGHTIAASVPEDVQLDPLSDRSLSGELMVDAGVAGSVVAATVEVSAKP